MLPRSVALFLSPAKEYLAIIKYSTNFLLVYFILLFIRVLYWHLVSGRCNEEQNDWCGFVAVYDEVRRIDTAILG
jgi:cbb3-type cytochrome oxidase subunit 3